MSARIGNQWIQRIRFALLAWTVGVCSAAARPSQPPAITNSDAIVPWLRAAATGRADFVSIGDSNQLQTSTGWDHGITKALAARFGLYATSLMAPGENSGLGAGSGFDYNVAGPGMSTAFQPIGAPAWLNERMAPNVAMYPFNYMYLPAGQSAGASLIYGLFINQSLTVDVNSQLRFSMIHGAFPPGDTGTFRLFVRNPAPPYQAYAETPIQAVASGTPYGINTSTLDLPAGPRNTGLYFRLGRIDENVTGPLLVYYMRAENRQRLVGVSHHTLYGFGGKSAFDMALALNAADDSYLSLFFGKVRELQGPNPHVLIRINTGANDRNETRPSYANFVVPGDSATALVDNLTAIMDRIHEIWTLNGWPQEEVFFLLTVTHPVSSPDDPQLEEYRAAAAFLATQAPRTASVNLGAITSWGEAIANGWYPFGGFDTNHLLQAGYEVIGKREIAALEDGRCWRDLNADQKIDLEDLYRWNVIRTDLNGDSVGDFTDERSLTRAIRFDEPADTTGDRNSGLLLP